MSRRTAHEDVAAALRDRLRAADDGIVPPPGLWERIQTPPATAPARQPGRRRRALYAAVSAAAIVAAVALIAVGAWWLGRPGQSPPAVPVPTATLTVYNAETPCQPLRTMECALRLARDPYEPYASAGNSAGKVWHGDRLAAICVVINGTLVQDESGITSARWYLVSTPDGTHGWLPGVRTRNTTDIGTCTASEARVR
ncbi:hypothetical protein [Streptomyces silvisoli]|uniref:Uncharacterized protein n=1 Tax=Streptomyces silvisoli TaxID=3034235 RepID=A0ABT5ZI25_9ACTN|nr:hypothetical protein [Streptomyces silvisoli]MDF3289471.1 hypothetical protein [Streptomyces silvisoli]